MALDFQFLSLKKDSKNRHYNARIKFQGKERNYEIHTNANMRYLDFLPKELRLSILDGSDCPFQKDNGKIQGLYLKINGIDKTDQKNKKDLKNAIIRFISKNYCED